MAADRMRTLPPAEFHQRLGLRVMLAMKAAGLSRRELAHHAGCSCRFVEQLENGHCGLSAWYLSRLAVVLDVTTDYLVRG